jgi:hypothetical protein
MLKCQARVKVAGSDKGAKYSSLKKNNRNYSKPKTYKTQQGHKYLKI